jgi:glucose/arabinose dehydrogenase
VRRALLALCLLAAVPVPARADDPDGDGLRLVKVGDFSIPVHATAPPGDPHRLMVVEQGADGSTTARIRVVRDGNLLDDSFLDLTGVSHRALEQGLLSMVFAPDYATSGRFYVSYTDDGACTTDACDLAVDEYTRSDDDHADATSRRRVLTVPHQSFRSHYGAMLATGPDGRVYLSTGDSGSAVTGDPDCNSQHSDRLQGKLLRLDPLGASAEVVSLGLRNPYRFAFDRMTGDFVVGDVGQSQEEEIDFVPAGGLAGANFGWNVFEGNAAFADRCASAPLAGYVAPGIT